jgi:hypothetical protein
MGGEGFLFGPVGLPNRLIFMGGGKVQNVQCEWMDGWVKKNEAIHQMWLHNL